MRNVISVTARGLRTLVLTGLLITAAGCDNPVRPKTDPYVVGWITAVHERQGQSWVMIEEFPDRGIDRPDHGSKVEFLLDPAPPISIRFADGRVIGGGVPSLVVGTRASGWALTVDESLPAVASALLIEVEPEVRR